MTNPTAPLCNIYAIRHPDTNAVFYVGQTVRDAKRRFREHILASHTRSDAKSVWLHSLITAGKVPSVEVIEQCALTKADAREQHWIRHYYAANPALLNRAGVDDPSTSSGADGESGNSYRNFGLGAPTAVEWTMRVAAPGKSAPKSGGCVSRMGKTALWGIGVVVVIIVLVARSQPSPQAAPVSPATATPTPAIKGFNLPHATALWETATALAALPALPTNAAATPAPRETLMPTNTARPPTPTDAPVESIGILPGLRPADVTVNLEDRRGMDCASAEQNGNYYVWVCERAEGDISIHVEIYAKTLATVDYITAHVLQLGEPSDDLAEELLGFIATMPYDGAEPDAARAWVEETLPTIRAVGDVRDATFGGVDYHLMGGPSARILEMGVLG